MVQSTCYLGETVVDACIHPLTHVRNSCSSGVLFILFFSFQFYLYGAKPQQLSIRGTLCPEYFFPGASFQSWCNYLCPLHVINLTVLYLMLLPCVWSHLLFVGALSSPSLGSQKATAAGCPPYTCVCWKSPPVSSDCCGFSVKSWPHDIKRVERTVVLKLRVINKTEIKTWILCHFESLQRETTFSKQHWCLHRSTHTRNNWWGDHFCPLCNKWMLGHTALLPSGSSTVLARRRDRVNRLSCTLSCSIARSIIDGRSTGLKLGGKPWSWGRYLSNAVVLLSGVFHWPDCTPWFMKLLLPYSTFPVVMTVKRNALWVHFAEEGF